jgi:hypothetical protein
MNPMKSLRHLTVLATASLLLPTLSQPARVTAAESSPEPPEPPPVLRLEEREERRLEHQMESLADAIDALAVQYPVLLQQQLQQIQGGLSSLPELLELQLGTLPGVPMPPSAPAPPRGPRAPGSVLTLHSTAISPDDQAALREDLMVMTRVLERAAGEQGGGSQPVRVMGLELMNNLRVGGQPARTLYLDDYGAVFALQVRFPLLPPAVPAEPNPSTSGQADSEWEAARRELYGQNQPGGPGIPPNLRVQALVSRAESYDATKVERLQESLLQALKEASRIRGLQPDDHLLLYVQGAPSSHEEATPTRERVIHTRSSKHNAGEQSVSVAATSRRLSHSGPANTVMTLRVTKGDADAFAQGNLDLEAFRDRARTRIDLETGSPGLGLVGF